MVMELERTWEPGEAARVEVLRLYDESCASGATRTAADIARELTGLKERWTQGVISREVKRRRAAAKADAKRTPAPDPAPEAEEGKRPQRRARAESAPSPAPKATHRRGGALVAWGAFALGLAVSIASNVGHVVFVVGVEEHMRIWSMGMAALWPMLLAVAVEVVSRVAWPRSWRWWLPGYVGTAVVGLIAFTISYQHLHGLLLAFGESGLTALLGPIALDLTIVVAGVALLAIGEARKVASAQV